jgi:hypothetical protein
MPIQDIAEFLFYIAPGYIAIRFLRWRFPVRERDSFHEIASSVVLGVLIISLLKWIDQEFLNYLFESNKSGFPSLIFLLAIVGFGIISGIILIFLNKFRFYLAKNVKLLRFLSSGIDPVWLKLNDPDNQDWAIVFLDDGSIYSGWISNYTFNPNYQEQDFLLSRAKRHHENLCVIYEIDGSGVYINTRDVKRIEFRKGKKKS